MHSVKTYGILRDVKKILTKKTKEQMCSFILEDYYDKISGIIFPREYQNFLNLDLEGKIVLIEGNIQIDYYNGNETRKVIVKNIIPLRGPRCICK